MSVLAKFTMWTWQHDVNLQYTGWPRKIQQSYQVSRIRRDITHLEGLEMLSRTARALDLQKRLYLIRVLYPRTRARAPKN